MVHVIITTRAAMGGFILRLKGNRHESRAFEIVTGS